MDLSKKYLVLGEFYHPRPGFGISLDPQMGVCAVVYEGIEQRKFRGELHMENSIGFFSDSYGLSEVSIIEPPRRSERITDGDKYLTFIKKYQGKDRLIRYDFVLDKKKGEAEYWIGTWGLAEDADKDLGVAQMVTVPLEGDLMDLKTLITKLSKLRSEAKLPIRLENVEESRDSEDNSSEVERESSGRRNDYFDHDEIVNDFPG